MSVLSDQAKKALELREGGAIAGCFCTKRCRNSIACITGLRVDVQDEATMPTKPDRDRVLAENCANRGLNV
jgi:hypothetical protein